MYSNEERDEFDRTGRSPGYPTYVSRDARGRRRLEPRVRLLALATLLGLSGLLQLMVAMSPANARPLVSFVTAILTFVVAVLLLVIFRAKVPSRALVWSTIGIAALRMAVGMAVGMTIVLDTRGLTTSTLLAGVLLPMVALAYSVMYILAVAKKAWHDPQQA